MDSDPGFYTVRFEGLLDVVEDVRSRQSQLLSASAGASFRCLFGLRHFVGDVLKEQGVRRQFTLHLHRLVHLTFIMHNQ